MNRCLWSLSLGLALSAAACGGTEEIEPERPFDTVVGIGAALSFVEEREVSSSDAVQSLGLTAEGALVAVIDGAAYVDGSAGLEMRSLYVGAGDPTSLGAVNDISPRAAGGAWISSDAGLFALDGLYVTHSPLLSDSDGINAAVEVDAGPLSGMWLATREGINHLQDDVLKRYEIPQITGSATTLAAAADGTVVAALFGSTLVLLEPSNDQILSEKVTIGLGAINQLSAGANEIFVAAERGLFRYRSNETPRWDRYTLTDDPTQMRAAVAMAVDPVSGRLWAHTQDAILGVDQIVTAHVDLAASMEPVDFAIDRLGDLWTASSAGLTRARTTETNIDTTFAADVLPWIQDNCSRCHMNQTQNFEDFEVFGSVAEDALRRVRSGDMPRCSGGVRCGSDQNLLEPEYAVLEQWIRSGKAE